MFCKFNFDQYKHLPNENGISDNEIVEYTFNLEILKMTKNESLQAL
jgi:hypothetical protein